MHIPISLIHHLPPSVENYSRRLFIYCCYQRTSPKHGKAISKQASLFIIIIIKNFNDRSEMLRLQIYAALSDRINKTAKEVNFRAETSGDVEWVDEGVK